MISREMNEDGTDRICLVLITYAVIVLFLYRERSLMLVQGIQGSQNSLILAVNDGVEGLVSVDVTGDESLQIGDDDIT